MIAVINTLELSQEDVLPSMTSEEGCGEVFELQLVFCFKIQEYADSASIKRR